MKSFVVLILSIIVTIAILAPSFITLLERNSETTLVIDFNEQEKKEEKKELEEKNIFFYVTFFSATSLKCTSNNFLSAYNVSYKTNTLEIFLPPPKFIR